MPRVSRQDRYNFLLVPENTYNTLSPHPQAQTIYGCPYTHYHVYATLVISCIPLWVNAILTPNSRIGFVIGLTVMALSILFFVLTSPAIGPFSRRTVETPTAIETIYVHRPLIGFKRLETLYGVTGGNPYKTERLLNWELKVRYEPAIWIVNDEKLRQTIFGSQGT